VVTNGLKRWRFASAAKPGPLALARANACMACHGVTNKIVGPALSDIAVKYKGDAAAAARLAAKVKGGSSGAWGPVPMPAQGHVTEVFLAVLVDCILGGAIYAPPGPERGPSPADKSSKSTWREVHEENSSSGNPRPGRVHGRRRRAPGKDA
jgi:cytochrome c551/c552